jgi:hypothetical protein
VTRLLSAAFGLLLCVLTASANATILFAGGEDTDFTPSVGCGGSCSITTNGTFFRTSWAREALQASAGYWSTPTFSANATVWIHAQIYIGTSGLGSSSPIVAAVDSAGYPTLVIRTTATANTARISSQTSGGVFTDLATCSSGFPIPGTLQQVDWYINYGTSGTTTLYINSVPICTYSGNITNGDGATTLDQSLLYGVAPSGGNFAFTYWSEAIVATTQTTAMNLYTLVPNGNGNATQWSNSSGTTPCTSILNATTINNANYVYTGTNSQIEECTVTHSIPAGNFTVPALVMSMNGLVGATGPQNFAFLTRAGGTDYASSNVALTNSFSNISNYIQTTNPATSSPWAVTDLTATGFNIGLESEP